MTSAAPILAEITVGSLLPTRSFAPDNVQLMLYNAVLWNGHRIHFDAPYATEVEGYPGLVIAGPLLGDWMHQCVDEWLGDNGQLTSFEYSNRLAAYVGETLTVGGQVQSVDPTSGEVLVDLFVKNEAEATLAPGVATVRFTL